MQSNMEGKSTSKAEYIIQQLNVNNAKKVALLMIIGFIIFHGLIHIRFGMQKKKNFTYGVKLGGSNRFFFLFLITPGSDSCKWLLSDGRLKRDREWQPYGCMIHQYSETYVVIKIFFFVSICKVLCFIPEIHDVVYVISHFGVIKIVLFSLVTHEYDCYIKHL